MRWDSCPGGVSSPASVATVVAHALLTLVVRVLAADATAFQIEYPVSRWSTWTELWEMSSNKSGLGIRRVVGGQSSSRLVRDEALPSCLRRSEKEDSAEEEEDAYDASDGVCGRTGVLCDKLAWLVERYSGMGPMGGRERERVRAGLAGNGTDCAGVRWWRRAEIVFGALLGGGTSRDWVVLPRGFDGKPPLGRGDG